MALKLFLDTNVFIDALANRQPFGENAKLILALGMLGEFELWFSASQATDIHYVLSDGGKKSRTEWATEQVSKLRKFTRACSFNEEDLDGALASTWPDFEDSCINQVVHKVKPDAVITGNTKDFVLSDFPVFDCNAFFAWIEQKHNLTYREITLS